MGGCIAMNLIKEYLPIGTRARPGYANQPIKSITIHWIGPYPQQSVYTPYYWWRDGTDGKGVEASAHYIVKNNDVLQAIPIDEVAWHCGNREGNYTSIGIEVIPMNEYGRFDIVTTQTLRELLKILPEVPLIRHFDWTGKDCPKYYTPLSNRVGVNGQSEWEKLVKELTR
jgi:N-acetylmuramoyl-L-alanine amidase